MTGTRGYKKVVSALGLLVLMYGLLDVPALAKKKWKYMVETSISWRAYGEAAFAEARRTNRPLFVLIFADWCEWCRKYEIEALETPQIRKRLDKDYIPVAVDQVKQPDLARRLGAKLVPTTLLLTPDGKKLSRFYGVTGSDDLADTLDRILALWRQGELPYEEFGDAETCCPLMAPPEGRK